MKTGDRVRVSNTGEFKPTDDVWLYLCELPEEVLKYTMCRHHCQCVSRHGAYVIGCAKDWRYVEKV